MKPFDLFSNAVRAKEIASVLVRHGFGDLLEQLGIPKTWLAHFVPKESQNLNIWQRLRVTLEELGPTFVKFGQVLSNRADILPEALINELKQLRSNVRATPWEEMEEILLEELPGSREAFFSQFNPVPVACGSIGQVYQATLAKNGNKVAVKLQRPKIKKAIRSDIEIIGWLARQLHEKIEELQPYDLPDVVVETGRGMMQELDFSIEARNAILFNSLNPDPDHVFAPQVYDEFTSHRLLITEWIDGTAVDQTLIPLESRRELARIGGQSVFHQIVISGFFHADPHGGNILVTPDARLCFIDWGLAGQLTRQMRYFLADLFSAIAAGDPEKVVRVVGIMAIGKRRIDYTRLEKDVGAVLRRHHQHFTLNEAIGRIMLDLLYVFGSNGIQLARDYALLAKAVISIEEVGKTLDPEFDIRSISRPYLEKLAFERWNPLNILKHSWWNFLGHMSKMRELPGDLQRFFRRLEDGDIKIKMQHEGLGKLTEGLDSGINRLVLAIITAALLLSSAQLVSSTIDIEPRLFSFPTSIGSIGFVLSSVFGLWLIFDIIRHGGHKK